jgi:SAM-dependent methyltransferase
MIGSAHRDGAALPASSVPAVTARGVARAAFFHYGRVLGNGTGVRRAVAAALQAQPHERVLDVGCGTGGFCLAVPGDYVGIDPDPDYVAFARWRWAAPRRTFYPIELATLPVDAPFDKAMLVNCVHHVSDDAAAAILERLTQLVRHRVVVADLDPDAANRLQAFLIAHDRGHFVRPRAIQRALLARHFRVVDEGRFRNTPHTAVHTLFVCEPKS